MYDVMIIGCGITGAAAAYELSKYKLSVAVLEAENDVSMGATKANSAIIHAGYDPHSGTLMARLNVRGNELAHQLCRDLDVPFQPVGSFVLAFSDSERTHLEELLGRGLANGVPGIELLDGDQARAMEPNLSSQVVAALYAPSAGIISPWEYCLALAETAVQNGAELYLNHAVTGMARTTKGWRVETASGIFEGRFVLNAAGLFSDQVHDMAAPHAFAIQPGRGQYYLLDKSEGARVSRVIFQCPNELGKGVLVAPTVHGNLIVGPNAEPVVGNDTATTAEGLTFVREKALKSVPSIEYRQSIRNFSGVRATSSTGDFVLGEAEGAPGFFDLAGISSPGLSSAPAIAEYMADLLRERGLVLEEKGGFRCTRKRLRFHDLTPQEKAELTAREPSYGRVVCRCETVTEGEVLACLKGPIPPRSLDGVKRRVGAGMGRCQGGFCSPRVLELLCHTLELDPTQVVQDHDGSWLLCGETKEGGCHV